MKHGKRIVSLLLGLTAAISAAGAAGGTASAAAYPDAAVYASAEAEYALPRFTQEDLQLFLDALDRVYGDGYPTGEVTLSRASDAAVLCGMCSATPEYSIGIGQLADDDGYIVILGGTDLMATDENVGIREDLLSALNRNNKYYRSVLKEICENIPRGSNLYLYGYSLGGMVLQQAIADEAIKDVYNIVNCVAFGSPMTTLQRDEIVFLEDSSDVVPYLAPRFVIGNRFWKRYDTHIVRDGGYKSFIGGHALSYVDSPVWDDVDIFGSVGGDGVLTLDMSTYQTFRA